MKNYHTHTKRCRHATGEDREYVEAAIKAGFEEIGFSDHSPMLFSNDHISTFRMYVEEAEDYANSIKQLKEEYKNQISIKLGFELEYYPQLFENTLSFLKQFDYDYLILGQHYTDNEFEDYAHYTGRATSNPIHLDKYINQALAGIKTGEFAYIAHPDLINFTGDKKLYVEKMTYFCEELKALNCPLEFNMLGFSQKRNYPNKTFWDIVAQVKNDVIVGFDAHSPESLTNKSIYNDIIDYLKKLNIQPIDHIEFRK